MALYMFLSSYSRDTKAAMIRNPQDRSIAMREFFNKCGAKLHELYYCVDPEYDVVGIVEMPDDVGLVYAQRLIFGATGATVSTRPIQLLRPEDGVRAMQRANEMIKYYKPPTP